jgi:hypothetical protein
MMLTIRRSARREDVMVGRGEEKRYLSASSVVLSRVVVPFMQIISRGNLRGRMSLRRAGLRLPQLASAGDWPGQTP